MSEIIEKEDAEIETEASFTELLKKGGTRMNASCIGLMVWVSYDV